MSGCNDEVDQCEKRKSIDAAMGDVLGKESASATEHEDDINSNDQTEKDGREEADGAPAESVVAKDNNDDPSTVRVNVSIGETTNNTENQPKADATAKNTTLEKDNVPVPSDSLVASGSPPRRAQGPCCCDACKDRRDLLTEQLEEVTRLQGLWMELRQHIRSVFRAAMDINCIPRSPRPKHDKAHLENMHEITLQLCKRDPHQLFMRLEGQAQEFVVETKVRLLDLLQNRNANNLAEIFLTGLLDGYDALLSAASHLSSLIEPLETEHLCKFNVTWDCLNKRLYQSCVYTDPLVQNNLPPFIGQLRKLLPLKGVEYQGLVHRYLAFDDEMTRISDMWPEAERLIDKYNQEQATLKAKQKMLREDWELFKARRKLIQQRMWNRTSDDLTEFDEQLLTLATLGAVGALSPNSRPPSPNSELSLEALNLPLDGDILESLAQDSGKSAHLRLADMVGALASTDDQTGINGHSIVPPTSLNGHCGEPEYWFGYECAVNHILNYGFVTPSSSPRTESPSNDERGNGEGSEGDVSRNEEQKCECHVCTEPRTSPTHVGKGSPLSLNLHTNNFNPFPPISNGPSGGTNCTATNGSVDMNGVYPHLYNLHAALGSVSNKVPTDPTKSSVDKSDEKKLRYFSPQVRKKSEEIESRTKQRDESASGVEDTDLREMEPQPCPCVYQHAKEIVERKKEVLENPPCSCLLKSKEKWDACPCLKKVCPDPGTTNDHAPAESPTSSVPKTAPATRKVSTRSNTTQPAPIQTRHSTTQTPNMNHNHNNLPHPGPTHAHSHAPLPDLVKGQPNVHRGHTHANHAPHACHKQADVEHIKRVSCTDLGTGDGDCSDSGSSQEDSCSTTSSTPRDSSRHCDCCYCEVFGHGVPSVAPVSRNYNEMRERLRQLLTKKKAKKCKAVGSPAKTPVETTSTNVGAAPNTQANVSGLRPNTPVSVGPVQNAEAPGDQRDLEALLEFIEGNQSVNKKDNKKAEKKAKQKQKKLEEKLKKDKEEAEQQRLVELQKKTPEVTITVVDPQKPALQRLLPQHTLPEVSILPALGTSSVPVTSALRQSSKKKEKNDTVLNANQAKSVPAAQKTKNGLGTKRIESDNSKSKNVNSSDQTDGVRASTLIPEERNAKLEKKCKKERQKLKREAAKAQEAALAKEAKEAELAKNAAEVQPQIVTIKRVMESSSTEPTVTITLKGQTPEEDKVLFTLVNGQTKEPKAENQGQKSAGKKKKNKGNQQQQSTKSGVVQQPSGNSGSKQQRNTTTESKNAKNQSTTEKAKIAKASEDKSTNSKPQSNNCGELKTSKSKKEKRNVENKENLIQPANNANKGKNQQVSQSDSESKKKQGKVTDSQSVQSKQQNSNGDTSNKKTKGQSQEKNNQTTKNKGNVNVAKAKSNNQNNQNPTSKGPSTAESHDNTATSTIGSPLSSQFKNIEANSEINIDNLILPPGITITKVNTPAKPVPVRSALPPKPVSPPKQTTIIAAPMGRVQSNYASAQAGGNVIVVDTGKLKQDLLPQASEKDCPKDNQQKQSTNGKKKKKKSKNGTANSNPGQNSGNSNGNVPLANGHLDEQARIVHNPGSNMVTIRNPAFGPPKMEPTQQAAIIKVSENGMVTIRSPALQQAINAGLTPPPKPDFIVKGDPSSVNKTMPSHNSPAKQNSIIPSSLAELRSRLTPDCTGLARLANIHISKVTSGQDIPENGINLKGTSVTLTKVRSEAVMENVQQAKTAVREAISATMAATSSGKGKKKKKKGNGSRQNGDDWNLVESVFTPKDIDLEDGEMDDAERELEAFKRFCLQSVPPARKEKVNLNIKDIVLKKKSQTVTAIAAN